MSRYLIYSHSFNPGPGYWDFKCLDCGNVYYVHAPLPIRLWARFRKWRDWKNKAHH